MKFTLATVLALGTTVQNTDAFVAPGIKLSAMDVKVGPLSSSPEDEDIEVGDQSGSRFKELMQIAKQRGGAEPGGAAGAEGHHPLRRSGAAGSRCQPGREGHGRCADPGR